MSLFAPPLIFLFFFSGFAVAGLFAPDCTLTTWGWTFNSLGQNACTVAAYMMSTCHGGSFTVETLPAGYHYSGPYQSQGTDLCMCNTVGYALLSACDACQGSDWISWLSYAFNCTNTMPPSSFPNPVPAGTRLPRWTLLDVTIGGTWDAINAKAAGDIPELAPGAAVGPAGSSSFPSAGPSTITPTYSSTSPQVPAPTTTFTASLPSYTVGGASNATSSGSGPVGYSAGGHSSNTGAIAGGTVAAVAAISIIVVALFFYRQRRRSQAQSAPSAGNEHAGAYYQHVDQVPQRPLSGQLSGQETAISSLPGTSVSHLRPYNPEDRTTFPEIQGAQNPSFISGRAPSYSNTKNIYTVATPPSAEA